MQNTDSSGSMRDQVDLHQMHRFFNRRDLWEKTEDGTLGLLTSESLGEGFARFALILAGWQRICPDAMDGETLQQKTTHKRRKNSQLQDLQRQGVVQNMFGILVSRFRVLLGTMEQRPKVVRYIVFYMCGVAQHAEDTPGPRRQGTNPIK